MSRKTQSTDDSYIRKDNGKRKNGEMLKKINPSLIHSWHWCEKSFAEATDWLLEHPQEVRRGQYMSDTPGKEVWRLKLPASLENWDIILKAYVEPHTFWDMFSPSDVLAEVRNHAVMKRLGVPTARILACGEYRTWGIVRRAYVVTEYLDGMISGTALMPGGLLWDRHDIRWAFSRKAMEIIAQAHRYHFYHRAFKPGKILMPEKSTVKTMHLTMIDMSNAAFRSSLENEKLLIARDLLSFFVDMRLDMAEIQELCGYYLKVNPAADYTVDTLWNQLVALGS